MFLLLASDISSESSEDSRCRNIIIEMSKSFGIDIYSL